MRFAIFLLICLIITFADELLFSNSSHASQERKKTNHILKALTIGIDGADIFELKGILMKRLYKDQLQSQKFLSDKKMAGFSEEFNDCSYLLEIDSFKVRDRFHFE